MALVRQKQWLGLGLGIFSAIALSACSKSDLDVCIDQQMAVWEEDRELYDRLSENMPEDDGTTVNMDGVEVPSVLMGPGVRNPGTEAEARAQANLRCGRIYYEN